VARSTLPRSSRFFSVSVRCSWPTTGSGAGVPAPGAEPIEVVLGGRPTLARLAAGHSWMNPLKRWMEPLGTSAQIFVPL
jgi:hypothetical protein